MYVGGERDIECNIKMSKNRRITLIFGGFVTAVAATLYPIFFYPLTHKDEYSKYLQVFPVIIRFYSYVLNLMPCYFVF